MSYSEMSDVEIALTVGKLTSFDGLSCIGSSGKAYIHDWNDGLCIGWKEFDPCNSWADAGVIIAENKISMVFDGSEWWADASACWVDGCEWNIDCEAADFKPLRAAMIAFLIMQESK